MEMIAAILVNWFWN